MGPWARVLILGLGNLWAKTHQGGTPSPAADFCQPKGFLLYVSICSQLGPFYGKPYTTHRRFIAGLCERAGVKAFDFHALRRYVASVLADTHKLGAKTIQRILRHKNLATTERYIKKINQDLRESMNLLASPRYAQKNIHPGHTPTNEKEVNRNG